MIENILNFIAVDIKRIADALEKDGEEVQVKPIGVVKEKKKRKTKKTKEKPVIETTDSHDVSKAKEISVDDLDGKPETTSVLNSKMISADDVKDAARIFVDGKGTDGKRERFEIAQSIIGKLGAISLKTIVPEKYSEAINLFRKAVDGWKNTAK